MNQPTINHPTTHHPRTHHLINMATARLIGLALVVAACSTAPVSDTTVGVPATATAPPTTDASTTTTPSETTPTETSRTETTPPTTATTQTTSPTTGDFDTIECGETEGDLLCEAYELIQRHYVDEVDVTTLAAAAVEAIEDGEIATGSGVDSCPLPASEFVTVCDTIDEQGLDQAAATEVAVAGMVFNALDANSSYFDREALALIEEEQSGQIEGIGALVATEEEGSDQPNSCQVIAADCRLRIVSTIEGGPARAAELQTDDEFLRVDGESIEGWNVDEVTATVRGPAGTEIELTFLRDGAQFTVTIVRAAIQVPVVQSEMVGDVAYLRLNIFTQNAAEQVRDVLAGLLANDPVALVLDMRNNPGGLLDTSVQVASEFLGDGIVVSTQSPESTTTYDVEEGGLATDPDLPLYVLVNQGSASASEVVAGALSDQGRATIVGENTFGKNTVQQRFPLSNGGAIKLTIARWFTPDGRDFEGDGIAPDVEASLPEELTPEELVAAVVGLSTGQTQTQPRG